MRGNLLVVGASRSLVAKERAFRYAPPGQATPSACWPV